MFFYRFRTILNQWFNVGHLIKIGVAISLEQDLEIVILIENKFGVQINFPLTNFLNLYHRNIIDMQNSILVKAYINDIILEKKYFQEKEMDYYQFTQGNYFIRMTKNSLIKIKNIMPMLELKSIIMEPQIGIVKEVINYIYKIYEEED